MQRDDPHGDPPNGYRLASRNEVRNNLDKVKSLMSNDDDGRWMIAELQDGAIFGKSLVKNDDCVYFRNIFALQ